MAYIHNKSLFDDDYFRLKICSLNLKGLRSIPIVFTLVDSMSGLMRNGQKEDFEYPQKKIDVVQSWHASIMPRMPVSGKVR